MKDFLKHSALIFLIFVGASSVEARHKIVVVKPHSIKGKVVVVKPNRPKTMAMRPVNIRTGYIWVEGYWKWTGRYKKYVWVNGKVVKQKRNKIWVSGHWSRKHGGYFYVRGRWA